MYLSRLSLKNIIKLCLLCSLFYFNAVCFSAETVFYVLRYQTPDRMTSPANTLASLKNHYKDIDILIPQAYNINAIGVVNNKIEPEILAFATQHQMKIMPLVTNTYLSGDIAHQFLLNTAAQESAIKTLIELCQQNHFYGMQLDFEMIPIQDRDLLTHFYELAADSFHTNKLVISFAIAPVVTDKPTSLFLKKIYENWEGAYDLKRLGKAADFVTIMAYNQHGGSTTPGPTATLPWVRQTVDYISQFIPPNKISVGIADFSTHWYTGSIKTNNAEKISVQMRAIDYNETLALVHKRKATLLWDHSASIYYAIFSNHWLNEYLFVEDRKSFAAKYHLVKEYKLRGVSVFDLGTEDPNIWATL